MKPTSLSILLISIALVFSCIKPKEPPTLTTTNPSNTTINSVTSGGKITNGGGADVTARGVCWSTSQNPTISGTHTTDGTGTGSFTSNITGLTPGTKYYIKAYAVNSAGTGYGNEVSFTTTALAAPTLTTVTATEVTQTSAKSGGTITSDGGDPITSKGVCWSTSANPTIVDGKTTDGSGNGSFASSLTNLLPGTIYHVRAYATNSIGTGYGSDVQFTTLPVGLARVTTKALTAVSYTTATSGGDITDTGGGAITAKGVCYGTSPGPVIAGNHTSDGNGTATFTSNITGMQPGTNYYVRAYATNSAGTAYGNEVTFITTQITLATVTTIGVTGITVTSATSGGSISSAGGGTISAKGVCWSTSPTPTIADSKTTNGTGTATFVSSLTQLMSGTKYYIRAYATNEAGTAYGDETSFTTLASIVFPTVATSAISGVTATIASSGGNVTDAGNGTITARGVCWATSSGPTISGSHTTDGTGTGLYLSGITGLAPNTIYYVRAYATNSAGTSYGSELIFTTFAATDRDGNNYTSVTIGIQTWLVENLKTTKYNDGTAIPNITDTTAWAGLSSSAYCWYLNNPGTSKADYGALYNWYAVITGTLCPAGWHVPSDAEWTILTDQLGGLDNAGGKMKTTGTVEGGDGLWYSPNTGATNESNFTGLPGGYRDLDGTFYHLGYSGNWWTSNGYNSTTAWHRSLGWNYSHADRYYYNKKDGFSVRCLKN